MPAAVKTEKRKYTGEDIEVLEGLEHVRRRPSMYIGGVDARGLHHLIWEVVDNSVDEYLAGECDRIEVTLHKDGASVTVQDNGRGIPVDKHPKRKKSTLEVILTELYSGGKFSDKNYLRSGGLHGIGSSAVNALSEEMVATVHRDGHEWMQRYKRGRPTTPVKKVRPFRGRGTKIFFRPDDDIFRRVQFHPDTIRQHLEDISYIHSGLKITFIDETHDQKYELHHPDGLQGYLTKIITDDKRTEVHEPFFVAEKDEANIRVECVLKWTESTDEHVRSYVNGIRTRAGGTHESGFRSGIAKAVKNYMEVHKIKQKGLSITADDMREGIVGIVSAFHPDPMFQGQTKDRLNNPEMSSLVDGIVRPGLETWLNSNPSLADAIIGRIILAARAREASREAVTTVRRKQAGSRRSNLPGKLLDCRSTSAEECELFIVEGQSAGGTAASGRDSARQAVLPLKGKILNTESLALSKVLQNQEIKDLIESLGTGIGPHGFDPHRLRYGKRHSPDRRRQRTATTFQHAAAHVLLQAYAASLIQSSARSTSAQPPLYKVEVGQQRHYVAGRRSERRAAGVSPGQWCAHRTSSDSRGWAR